MKNMIGQFSRQQLELMITTDHAQCGDVAALARIALGLQDAPGKIYQIRKLDGSEEWQEWEEVDEGEYHASVNYDGWGRRILYAVPSDVVPNSPAIPDRSEWTNAQCLEFLTTAFRHNEIAGDVAFDDIRLGVKFALAVAPAPGGSDAN